MITPSMQMFPLKMYSIVRHKSNCVMPYGSYDNNLSPQS